MLAISTGLPFLPLMLYFDDTLQKPTQLKCKNTPPTYQIQIGNDAPKKVSTTNTSFDVNAGETVSVKVWTINDEQIQSTSALSRNVTGADAGDV